MPRFDDPSRDKASGATYTPDALARFLADRIATHVHKGPLRILDPAVGEGSLLDAMGQTLQDRLCTLEGFDPDLDALATARARLPTAQLHARDFLSNPPKSVYDVVIANPPYVRTQVLGKDRAQALAKKFGLTGRVDLVSAFVLAMLDALKPGGVGGWLVTNRILVTKAGECVRRVLREQAQVLEVYDLGDTKLFDAAVLPAMLILKRAAPDTRPARFIASYETTPQEAPAVDSVIDKLLEPGLCTVPDGRCFEVAGGWLAPNEDAGAVWRRTNEATERWLAKVRSNTWKSFGDVGAVRVGIKSTADRVFIRSDWEQACPGGMPELLRPLTTHHIARRFRPMEREAGRQVLYPHLEEGGRRVPVDLSAYPHSQAYLESHREQLEGRRYVQESSRPWFVVWVAHQPRDWARTKLVWRDIAAQATFWIDPPGTIVNGDCYWMVVDEPYDEDVLWLACAVGNSQVARRYYDACFGNRLYAGRRRWITQYVKHFPLPDPAAPAGQLIIAAAKKAWAHAGDDAGTWEQEVDLAVCRAFGVRWRAS